MSSEFDTAVAVGGVATTLGGAVGYLLNHLRQNRKDSYTQIREATQELIDAQNTTIRDQKDELQRLAGRLDQITMMMSVAVNEAADTKAELKIANAEIVRLKGEIDEWERRWKAHFPEKELV